MSKTIAFVSGGAGFIATTLIAQLVAQGKQVFAVDNLSNGSVSNIAHLVDAGLVQFYATDLSSESACQDAFEFARPDCVL